MTSEESEDEEVPPLKACETCYFWGRHGCAKGVWQYPWIGGFCDFWEREAGVEG